MCVGPAAPVFLGRGGIAGDIYCHTAHRGGLGKAAGLRASHLDLQLILTRMIQKPVQWAGVCALARALRSVQVKSRALPIGVGRNQMDGRRVDGTGTLLGVCEVWPFGRSAKRRPSTLLARPHAPR